jgi:hypothetical protein
VLASLDQLPSSTSTVYVLTPVVAVRIKPAIEEMAIEASRLSYASNLDLDAKIEETRASRDSTIDRVGKLKANAILLMWQSLKAATEIGGNAHLSDDLSDSLSSKQNLPVLVALLTKLCEIQRKHGIRCCVLSGDIHTGGVSEILCRTKGENEIVIPQVVSSPIASEPMMKSLKDTTSTEGEFFLTPSTENLADDAVQLVARNLFYRSDRNFCVITPHREADFYFERQNTPIRYTFS